jgi:uncharacterized delta-60 repeat protein
MRKEILIISVAIITAIFQFPINSYAQDGALDLTFGVNGKLITDIGGKDDASNSIAIQNDGKIVVLGFSNNGTNADFALIRYNANGTLDNSFGTGGKLTTPIGNGHDYGLSVAIQSDGKIVAAGYSSNGSNNDFAVVRYNSNGTLDTGFGTTGKVTSDFAGGNDRAYSLAIQSDGKIVVAGSIPNATDYDFAIARYNSNGTLDLSFDTDGKNTTGIGSGNDFCYSVAIQGDGKIIMAGNSHNGSNYDFSLVRYNSNGTLDVSFDTDGKLVTAIGSGNEYCYSLAIQRDGKIVAVGYSNNGSNNDFALARYNINGTLDTSFDADGIVTTDFGNSENTALSVAIQNDRKILVAGSSHNGIDNDFALVRYHVDGKLDLSFDTDGKLTTAIGTASDSGYSVALQKDGKIVLTGFSVVGDYYDFAIARYNNTVDTGIQNEKSELLNIDLYPNPASEILILRVNAKLTGLQYFISDLSGKTVLSGNTTSETTGININTLSVGMYFFHIQGHQQQTLKFIKK